MVFDEEKQEYMPRFGFKRANDASKQWVIEHKDTDGLLTLPTLPTLLPLSLDTPSFDFRYVASRRISSLIPLFVRYVHHASFSVPPM